MSKVTGSWERPVQGVSQQSDKDRLDGQCTLQENFIPSVLRGLTKRVGSVLVGKVLNSLHPNTKIHSYNRGTESYFITIEPNSKVSVFNKLGEVFEVSLPSSVPYIDTDNPVLDLQMNTIADTTFIVNNKVNVAVSTARSPENPNTAIVYCQYATYGRDYIISINGVTVAKYSTPDGSNANQSPQVKTDKVISSLMSQVQDTGLYNTEQHGNTLFITRKDKAKFTIDTTDSADGNDLVAIQDVVKQTTNLPPYAPNGYVIRVQEREGLEEFSYWLKAESSDEDQTGSSVRWVESLAPNTLRGLNKSTMPYILQQQADGSFVLRQGDWEERKVGNDKLNPFPSFIYEEGGKYYGYPLSGVSSFQGRIVLTSGESAIFGEAGNYFNLFRETTQTEADSDPIDIYADADEVHNLLHSAVLDGDLIFFTENGQFLIKGDKPITKSSVILKKVTSYPMNPYVKPATTGESVMFAFSSGKYSGLREMFTDSYTSTKRARPITEHVAEYIRGSVLDIVASPSINTLLLRTDAELKELYVYDWLWQDEQKIQAAFHKWVFQDNVLYATFINDKLYLLFDRPFGISLEVLPLGTDEDEEGLSFPIRLDMRTKVTAKWDGSSWNWELPFELDLSQVEFVRTVGCYEEDRGTSVDFLEDTRGVRSFSTEEELADWKAGETTCTLVAGLKYLSKYIPTRPYLKDGKGNVMTLDRFTVGTVTLNYESIGSIDVEVQDLYQKSKSWKYSYNGRNIGRWNNTIGFAELAQGTFRFPVRLPSERSRFLIQTEDYRPFILGYMEWQGNFNQRSRRL